MADSPVRSAQLWPVDVVQLNSTETAHVTTVGVGVSTMLESGTGGIVTMSGSLGARVGLLLGSLVWAFIVGVTCDV